MYKILDLRTGEYLKTSDIYWQESDASFKSEQEANNIINNLVYLQPTYRLLDSGEVDEIRLLSCYFQIVEI